MKTYYHGTFFFIYWYLLWEFLISIDTRLNLHFSHKCFQHFFDGEHSTDHAAMLKNNLHAIYLTLHIHQVMNNMLMLGRLEVTGP